MKKTKLDIIIATAIAMLTMLNACSNDSYETGDGDLSYLTADFGTVHTAAAQTIDRMTTDDGNTINFKQQATAKWATKADTTYRALVYYLDRPTGAEMYSASRVAVYQLNEKNDSTKQLTDNDPLTIKSAWISADKHYLTVCINVKSGATDDVNARQLISINTTSLTVADDGTTNATLRLAHKQGSVPQYYTVTTYVSIDISQLSAGSTITLTANTYDGEQARSFNL